MFCIWLQFFLQLLCISLVSLIFRSSAEILVENALFCRQNARLKKRSFCSKFCQQNLSKPTFVLLVLLLTIKISQSARENSLSYCKNISDRSSDRPIQIVSRYFYVFWRGKASGKRPFLYGFYSVQVCDKVDAQIR